MYCQSPRLTLVSESETTASFASTDDKWDNNLASLSHTPFPLLQNRVWPFRTDGNHPNKSCSQQKGACILQSHVVTFKYHMQLSNIHGLYRCTCNLFDIASDTVWTHRSCQAVTPTNCLGTRLKILLYYRLYQLQAKTHSVACSASPPPLIVLTYN